MSTAIPATLIAGDGIGPEIVDATLEILDARVQMSDPEIVDRPLTAPEFEQITARVQVGGSHLGEGSRRRSLGEKSRRSDAQTVRYERQIFSFTVEELRGFGGEERSNALGFQRPLQHQTGSIEPQGPKTNEHDRDDG